MLFSPPAFRLQVNRMTQEHPSGLLLTESGIQHRVPRRTLSKYTALQFPEVSGIRRLASRLPPPSCSGQPAPPRHVSGFPGLGLLWGLRRHGARALEAI